MEKEREIFLRQQKGNKGDGYIRWNLVSQFVNLNIRIPRDRNSEYRPLLLPTRWKRTDKDIDNLPVNLMFWYELQVLIYNCVII